MVATPTIPIGNDRNLTPPALMLQYYHAQGTSQAHRDRPLRLHSAPNLYRACHRAVCDGAVEATVSALLGAGLMTFGFWLKARSEEQFRRIELGPESYHAYCRRVPMLVPLISRRARPNESNPRGGHWHSKTHSSPRSKQCQVRAVMSEQIFHEIARCFQLPLLLVVPDLIAITAGNEQLSRFLQRID